MLFSSTFQQSDPAPVPEEPKLHALATEEDWQTKCVEQRRICAVAFLPSKDIDEEEHAKFVNVLESLVTKRGARDAFSIMWVDANKASKFRRALDLAVDLPSFAVVSPKKKGYSPFIGPFTDKAMGEFLDKVLSGSKRTIPVESVPPLFD